MEISKTHRKLIPQNAEICLKHHELFKALTLIHQILRHFDILLNLNPRDVNELSFVPDMCRTFVLIATVALDPKIPSLRHSAKHFFHFQFQSLEFLDVRGILHFFNDQTLLHLFDILFFDIRYQVSACLHVLLDLDVPDRFNHQLQ